MKKVLFCLAAVACLTACGGEEKAVEKVAYDYSIAMANYQIDEAEPYVSEETHATLDFLRAIVKEVPAEYIERDTPAEIEITNIDLTSDTTAWAHYHKTTPNKDFRDSIPLIKRDGRWLVHIPLIPRG